MISIVVPAHNEASVIRRLLDGLLRGYEPNQGDGHELEIVVACNGCSDETAEIAAGYGAPVVVVETDVASKVHALNLGDRAATGFPRLYIDADMEIDIDDVRSVARSLDEPGVLAASPIGEWDLSDASPLVREYQRFWETMPYFDDNLVGSGVYGLSEAGRARFDEFPDVICDDLFVRNLFVADERRAVAGARHVKRPPRTIASMVRTRSRSFAGRLELRQLYRDFPELRNDHAPSEGGAPWSRVRRVASRPRLWIGGAVYTYVYVNAWIRAWMKVRRGQLDVWDRDETARTV